MQSYPRGNGRTCVQYGVTEPAVLITGAMALLGLALFFFGVQWRSQRMAFVRYAVPGVGTVIDFESESSSDGPDTYRPVVRYVPAGAVQPVIFKSKMSSSRWDFDEGDEVPVLYMADAPHRADLKASATSPLGETVCFILGTVFAGIFGAGAVNMVRGFETNSND